MEIPNRLVCITTDIGPFAVTMSFVDGHAVEMFMTDRGKSGTQLDDILYELGVTVSKMMQGEIP